VTRKMLQKVLQKNSLPYGEILLIIFNTFEFVTENVTCNKKIEKKRVTKNSGSYLNYVKSLP